MNICSLPVYILGSYSYMRHKEIIEDNSMLGSAYHTCFPLNT